MMSVELLGVISDACMWGAVVLLAITVAIQEIRIGKCETACRATAMRVTRMANASETAQNAHSGEIITKTNNHR